MTSMRFEEWFWEMLEPTPTWPDFTFDQLVRWWCKQWPNMTFKRLLEWFWAMFEPTPTWPNVNQNGGTQWPDMTY